MMTDHEFLYYCRTHCGTPRAAFVPAQIARLHRLAGHDDVAEKWDAVPNQILDGYRAVVLDLVGQAERSMRETT